MEIGTEFWVGFIAFLMAAIGFDLGLHRKKDEALSVKDSMVRVKIWVALAVIFGAWVWHYIGAEKGLEFFTGYIIELSLSMDNVFIIAIIFSYFSVPIQYQHRVLFWGIVGALMMRGAMIWAGSSLITEFGWVLYIFGAFLILTGIKLAFTRNEHYDPSKNPVVRVARRLIPITDQFHGKKFWVKQNGRWMATPLFVVLLLIEATDLVFAVDSVPAIFAVTLDPFVVFTANAFAILGLRSMYFLLAGMITKFYYLKLGLAVLLIFVGVKMSIVEWYHIPTTTSLAAILAILGVAVMASILRAKKLKQ
ncbi:MAG: TerC family protein [Rickettsiales bacterium]|nr:TerC family protein [Rickettsiales bacterium]